MHFSNSILVVLFSALVHARTDLTGCTRTDVSSPAGASYAWIVPDTGELCDFLDCGGGRAPPKTTVPGCLLYVGTKTYKPSFLAGFSASMTADGVGSMEASVTPTAAPTFTSSTVATATATAAVDDGTDTDDERDADDVDDFYDLMDIYPSGWKDMTPKQQADWWLSYGYNSAAITTALTSSTMTGASISAQQSMAISSHPSVSSSTSNSTILDTTSTASITTSTSNSPTLVPACTISPALIGSLSMSRSWVKTIPTFARGAADVENDRASISASRSAVESASASASLVDSTGAAGKVDCVVVGGGAGVVAAVIGALFVL